MRRKVSLIARRIRRRAEPMAATRIEEYLLNAETAICVFTPAQNV